MEEPTSDEQLMEIVKKITEVEGIFEFEVQVEARNQKGQGYVADFEFVAIHEKKSKQVKNYAIKKEKKTSEEYQANSRLDNAFVNEIYFYTKTYAAFFEFQEKRNIQDKFPKVPRCIMTCTDKGSQMLVFENLKSNGFKVTEKSVLYDDDHVKVLVNQYAKWHALSFAYREQFPDSYSEIKGNLRDLWKDLADAPFIMGIFSGSCKIAKASLKNQDDRVINEYQKYIDDFMGKFSVCFASNEKYSAVLHGDCWSNNFMFKYDVSGKPIDIRLIDWQGSRHGSPALDVSHCLYSGVGKDILENLDYYLKMYHDKFSSFLKEFGCNAEKLYPFEMFLEDWKKYSKFGMIIGLAVLRVKFTKQEDIIEFDEAEDFDSPDIENPILKCPFDEEVYYKTARDLILHVYERGAL